MFRYIYNNNNNLILILLSYYYFISNISPCLNPFCAGEGKSFSSWPISVQCGGQQELLPEQVHDHSWGTLMLVRVWGLKTVVHNTQIMETRGLLFLCVICLSLCTAARGGKKDIFARVVDLVSPGEEFLTEDALLSVFERLEDRVNCSGVSCGKVRGIWGTFGGIEVQLRESSKWRWKGCQHTVKKKKIE